MALAGLPPFSGFWGKFFLIVAGYQAGAWVTTTVALLVGLLTLASMMKIWTSVFWGAPQGQEHAALGHDRGMVGATLLLAALSVGIGLAAGPLFAWSEAAAAQLLAVSPYVDAVLSAAPVHSLPAEATAYVGGRP
jgi:multicomponent Na+:H+ antiporter subunit D